MMWHMRGFVFMHGCVFIQSHCTLYCAVAYLGPLNGSKGWLDNFTEVL